MLERRSYLICSVQRAGSWLLCHALEDTGVLGIPAEYFHRGDQRFWRGRWGASSEDAFLEALRQEPATANSVWGAKMMWNYFPDAVARLRSWPPLGVAADAADGDVLGSAFPGLRCVWLRRDDKLRQAISWWRADATGQYALEPGQTPAAAPAFDRDAIGRLVRFAEACETGWRDWFDASSVTPLELVYENLTHDLGQAVREVAGFLDVTLPPDLARCRPRLRRQPDHHTERLARLYLRNDQRVIPS